MTETIEALPPSVMSPEDLLIGYLTAKERVIEAGFSEEIDWQDRQSIETLTEPVLLKEAAWVILNAGMREAVIRGLFEKVSAAFLDWNSAAMIHAYAPDCIRRAVAVFAHAAKIQAITVFATRVHAEGFCAVKARLMQNDIGCFDLFPYIGPVTRFHLAKNLGLDVVKPDRHLVRMARGAGFSSPDSLCRAISSCTGDRLSVIDIVLWRFATLEPSYESLFDTDQSGCCMGASSHTPK